MRLYGGDWDGMAFRDLVRYREVFFGDNPDAGTLVDRDFTGPMPATYILACGLDPLLDDSRVLYEILRAKGHTAELCVKEGYVHGFLHYSNMLPGAEGRHQRIGGILSNAIFEKPAKSRKTSKTGRRSLPVLLA